VVSGVSYLIILLKTIKIPFKHIRSSLACSRFLSLRTVSNFLNLLSVHHSSFHSSSSLLISYPFPLINKTKTRPIASDSHLNTKAFRTVKLHFFRRAQAANQHGAPMPSSTAVPPRPWVFASFFVFLVWVILGCFISLGAYINFGIRVSSDSYLNPTLFLA